MNHRPWGRIDWLIESCGNIPWRLIGCIGTEERSLTAWLHLHQNWNVLDSYMLFDIKDWASEKYDELTKMRIDERYDIYKNAGGNDRAIYRMQLHDALAEIQRKAREAIMGSEHIILDISSMPKRFWFVILREILRSDTVRSLVITNTRPKSYVTDGEPLYEEITEPMDSPLPGFGGNQSGSCVWIASVGFMVESLRLFIESNSSEKVRLLFPFPAPTQSVRRAWISVYELQRSTREGRFDLERADPRNISSCFDTITRIEQSTNLRLSFAPFGPKPLSAAMCLYASQRESASVHYPQPSIYHPDYSRGIYNDDPRQAIDGHLIKWHGENLYSVGA